LASKAFRDGEWVGNGKGGQACRRGDGGMMYEENTLYSKKTSKIPARNGIQGIESHLNSVPFLSIDNRD
jgi:hypothetical protein